MTATLPQPPTHYSFDCPSCHSMLSLPVEMEGVVGPCPHCQTTLTAPPLVESPEYAEYYYAHQQAYAEATSYAEANVTFEPPAEVTPVWQETPAAQQTFAPVWPTQPFPAAAPEQVNYDYAAAAQWAPPTSSASNFLPLEGLPSTVNPFLESQTAPPPASASTSMPLHETRKSPLLKLALAVGLVGLAAGVYFTLKPKTEPDSQANYLPPAHVPLSPEEAAKLAAEPLPVPPPTAPIPGSEQPPTAPVPPPIPVAPPTAAEIETAPKAMPLEQPLVEPPTAPPVAKVIPETPVVSTPELEQPSLLEEPRTALKAFLNARNWQERAKHTQYADALLKDMKTYYTEHADGPVQTDSVDYLTSQPTPDGKSRFHLFQVHTGEGLGFPVSVESMDNTFKVDWRSFVEFKDLQLPKFFEKYSSQPTTFHAVLHRSHYFGSDVPDQEGKLCFAIEPPIAGYTNHVWVDKSNAHIISKLGERKEFGYVSYPVVSLRWVKEKDGTAYVTLFEIVADSWRSDATVPR